MLNEINIRPYEKGDDQRIVDFLTLVFNRWPSFDFEGSALDHWRWKFSDPKSVTIAEINGKIVGSFHSIPIDIKVGDKIISSCQGVDVAVHPDYQGMGIYSKIRDKCYDIRTNNGILMHYGISGIKKLIAKRKKDEKMNQHMFPLFPHKLCEYILIYDPDTYFENNNIYDYLKKISYKILKIINKNNTIKIDMEEIRINKIKKFDEKINIYWDDIKDQYKFILVKNMKYLNWRYCDKRGGIFEIFISVDKSNKIFGYIITRINKLNRKKPKGYIADLSYNNKYPEIGAMLLDHVLNYFNNNKINSVQAFTFKDSEIESLYKERSFIKISEPYLTITIFSDISDSTNLLQNSNQNEIHFSIGDLDWI